MEKYSKYSNYKTVETEVKKAEKKIAELEKLAILRDQVIKVLEQFEGKKVSKRIETALKKEIPKYTFYSENISFNINYLYIWGDWISFNNRHMVTISKFSDIFHSKNLKKIMNGL